MVVFGIGAQILDTLLIRTAAMAADTAFYIATWSARTLMGAVWTAPLTEEQRLRIEVGQLRVELQRLESNIKLAVGSVDIGGDEYLII
jgi:hypothetical protein